VRIKLEHRDVVVIGASAGGLEAISQILRGMPHDVDAAILIVLHTANRAASLLPQILARVSKLPVCHSADWDPTARE
jgi:two-component system, chemotaxis family, protein-glutamate methylesterase/glutaminase